MAKVVDKAGDGGALARPVEPSSSLTRGGSSDAGLLGRAPLGRPLRASRRSVLLWALSSASAIVVLALLLNPAPPAALHGCLASNGDVRFVDTGACPAGSRLVAWSPA